MYTARALGLALIATAALHATAAAQDVVLPRAEEGAGPQILVIPLTGADDPELAALSARLYASMSEIAGHTELKVIESRTTRADIGAVIGCDDDSARCMDETAETIGTEQILYGRIEPDPAGGARVTLSWYRRGQPVATEEIALSTREPEAGAREFTPKASRLVLGRAEPSPTEPQPQPLATVGPVDRPGFSFGRVRPYTWGLVGAGVAAAGVGAVLLVMGQGKQDEVRDAPTDTVEDLDELRSLENSGRALTLSGNVMVIAGGALAVTGAVLAWRQGRAGPPDTRPAAPADGLGVAPTAGGMMFTYRLTR